MQSVTQQSDGAAQDGHGEFQEARETQADSRDSDGPVGCLTMGRVIDIRQERVPAFRGASAQVQAEPPFSPTYCPRSQRQVHVAIRSQLRTPVILIGDRPRDVTLT